MDRSNFDPERDLDKGPYEDKGFTDELQQRIEESIERKARSRWLRAPILTSVIAAAAMLFLFMDRNGLPWQQKTQEVSATAAQPLQASNTLDNTTIPAQSPYNSGLLIGLRTDFQRKGPKPTVDNTDSSYRTLFIAPLNGRLDVAAEGKGILLPYGQVFWKIDAVTTVSGNSSYSTVIAHPANKPVPDLGMSKSSTEPLQHTEKLLFVGNKYVSLEQTESVQRGKRILRTSQVWVKELQQVNGEMTMPADQGQRSYVEFQDLFGAAGKRSDQWAIIRRPGNWVPSIATPNVEGDKKSYTLTPVPFTLPDAIVSHDQVCCTWADIKRIQPDAVDALSSPKKDFVAVVTPSNIYFYEDRNGKIGESPQLILNLNENETIIMTQWSTGSYVEEWVKSSRSFLKKS